MAFAAFPSTQMRPTALALNIVAAAYSARPLLLSSLPTALVGGFIVLDERVYKTTTGVVLLLAGAAMILRRDFSTPDRDTPLWCIGAPSRLAQALAPLMFGLLLEPLGRGIIVVSSALSLSALIALLLLQARTETTKVAAAAE